MAKNHDFRINVQRCDFSPEGHSAVHIGGVENCYYLSHPTCSLAEALATLKAVSDAESRPHAAFLSMASRSERKPSGFHQAKTTIYKDSFGVQRFK